MPSNISAQYFAMPRPRAFSLPLIDVPRTSAGFPSPAADYIEETLDLHELLVRNPSATFYVRVAGDSMNDALIFDKDILIVDRSKAAVPGKVVVAAVDGQLFVKRLRLVDGRLALFSENAAHPEYRPVHLDGGQEFILWGCVTGTVRQF